MSSPDEYVLGTGRDELERLALQHRLWADAAHAAWRLAGITFGQRVLDVGCGPGFAAFELAQLVGHRGAVIGVDESAGFIGYLNAQASARGLTHVRGVVADAQRLPAGTAAASSGDLAALEPASFDLAWSRWVLCFVPQPAAVVAGVARLLRPGGRWVLHDYFDYASMTTAPRRASHDRVVAATVRSFKARGGDPDICGHLPRLLIEAGFEVQHITMHHRVARRGDTMLQWPLTWWRTYAPKLVAMGELTQPECDELLADLAEIEASPTDFIQCPPVYELMAVRR